jgi:hypothetical protein
MKKDETGNTYGRLTALYSTGKTHGELLWRCKCICGSEVDVVGSSLRSGHTTSCGCLHISQITVHGMVRTPEYTAFQGAKYRCTNRQSRGFRDYGARGIAFLYPDFESFLRDVGPRPSPKYSLDRVDNEGNYQPGNCQWATRSQQMKNRRKHKALQNFSTDELKRELLRRGSNGILPV